MFTSIEGPDDIALVKNDVGILFFRVCQLVIFHCCVQQGCHIGVYSSSNRAETELSSDHTAHLDAGGAFNTKSDKVLGTSGNFVELVSISGQRLNTFG